MDKETLDKIENLRYRIEERICGSNLEGNESDLTAEDVAVVAKKSMEKYNAILLDKVSKDTKKLNRTISKERLINKKIPYISSITPTVLGNGEEEIVITFECNHLCKGIAIVHKDLSVEFEFMRSEYSIRQTLKVLEKNAVNFVTYFNALDSFSKEYPGIFYEWGKDGQSSNIVQDLDDGFINVRINLTNPDRSKATLSKLDDFELSRIRTQKYGELYDYIDFYNKSIMRHTPVNEEDLNPLLKQMVSRFREQMPSQGRVLRLK